MSTLSFTLIQSILHWENKVANLSMFEEKIATVSGKTQVVILPEMFSTGFSMKPELLAETMEGSSVNWMKSVAETHKIILTGSLIIKEKENYYNRLIWMFPNGKIGYYDKRHLFAYSKEDQHYSPGNQRVVTSVNNIKINLQVCYDLRFPVWSRQNCSTKHEHFPEYDILLYVANWPERRNKAWKTLLQARAIENQAYVIGLNRVGADGHNVYHSGDSMVVNALGDILYHKADDEDIFTITLDKEHVESVRKNFPFWKDADCFKILE